MASFEELKTRTQSETIDTVVKAIEKLEKLATPEAYDLITELIKHKHPDVRKASIKSLGHSGKPEFIPIIERGFVDERYDVRRVAAHAMGMIEGDEDKVIESLRKGLRNEDQDVKRFCLRALGRFHNPKIIEYIADGVVQGDSGVKRVAIDVLEKFQEESALEVLIRIYYDEDSIVRANAAEALGKRGDKKAIEHFKKGIKDPSSEVRRRTADAFMQLDEDTAIDALTVVFDEKAVGPADDAIDSLVKSKNPRVQTLIHRRLLKTEGDIQMKIVKGLGDFKVKDSVNDLLSLLETAETQQLRDLIVESLGHIGDPQAVKPLKKLYKTERADKVKIEIALKQLGADTKGGCFIATAVYGNELKPEVVLLRQFRDEVLLQSFFGKLFVKIYYAISPTLADAVEEQETIKSIIRDNFLNPFVKKVKNNLKG